MNLFENKTLKKPEELKTLEDLINEIKKLHYRYDLKITCRQDSDYDHTIVDFYMVSLYDYYKDENPICLDKYGNLVEWVNTPNSENYYECCEWFYDTSLFDTLMEMYSNIYKRYINYIGDIK